MHGRFSHGIKWLSAILFILLPLTSFAQSKPLTIAVAANFSPVLEKLLPEFERKTGITPQLITGASGVLYQQILHGAPIDIFLSADSERPQLLVKQNKATDDSRKTYAIGGLSLWSARVEIKSLTDLEKNNFQQHKLAIANPLTAPYGKASMEALKAMSYWTLYQKRLIIGNNINQTFHQVRSKSVNAGIVATSQLALNNYQGIAIPSQYYSPIKQQLVILNSSQKKNEARLLVEYLLHNTTQEKIEQLGYLPTLPTGNTP